MSPSPSAPPDENPNSPSPIPSPPESPRTALLFSQTSEPSRSSSTSPSPDPSPDVDAPPESWSPDDAAAPPDPDPAESSGTRSTGSGAGTISRAGLRTAIGQGVKTITGLVHSFAADVVEREHDLWRADEDDIDDISAPAARIVYRRLPAEAKGTDTIDLLHLALAVAGYVGKNLKLRAEIRKARMLAETAGVGEAAAGG